MGGGISGNLKESAKEVAELRLLPADASDVNDLEKGRREIFRLRSLCHRVNSAQGMEVEFLRTLEDLNPFNEEIKSQGSRPLDGSDVEDVEKAKQEIIKLRSIWLSIKLSEADLSKLITSDSEDISKSENPIISVIQQKITNEVALDYFRQNDANGSGLIERNELRRFIRMQGVVYTEGDLESLMDQYDINGDGKLAYGEFLKAFSRDSSIIFARAEAITSSVTQKFNSPEPLQSFKQSDRDSSGTVDRAEMRRLLRVNGIDYREEDFDSFFTLHDLSGDGKLSFEEFCRAMGYSCAPVVKT
jgi:Ca2+-binding EF-hand superfamily protein